MKKEKAPPQGAGRMTRKEKKAYIKEMKALEKRLYAGDRLTPLEMARLNFYRKQRTDYNNSIATRNLIAAGVISSISLLMIIVWTVVKMILLSR